MKLTSNNIRQQRIALERMLEEKLNCTLGTYQSVAKEFNDKLMTLQNACPHNSENGEVAIVDAMCTFCKKPMN